MGSLFDIALGSTCGGENVSKFNCSYHICQLFIKRRCRYSHQRRRRYSCSGVAAIVAVFLIVVINSGVAATTC